MPFSNHLKSYEGLITPYQETRVRFAVLLKSWGCRRVWVVGDCPRSARPIHRTAELAVMQRKNNAPDVGEVKIAL